MLKKISLLLVLKLAFGILAFLHAHTFARFGTDYIFAVLAGFPMFLSGFGIKEKIYI